MDSLIVKEVCTHAGRGMPVAQLERVWQWAWRVPCSCSGCCLLVWFYGRFLEEMLSEGGQYDYAVFVENGAVDFMQVHSHKTGSTRRVQLVVEFQKAVLNDVG